MYLATWSCLCKYSVFNIVVHPNIMLSTVSSLFVHNIHSVSTPCLMIVDWYTLVGMLWSCSANIKPSVSLFRLELLLPYLHQQCLSFADIFRPAISLSKCFSCIFDKLVLLSV